MLWQDSFNPNWLNSAEVVVVGSGFFGLTIAERIATELNRQVTIMEIRNHIGGNAHSYIDSDTGIEIHKYGTHLFHTSNEKIWNYVNSFTQFNNYEHKVFAMSDGQLFTLPVNLQTLSQLHSGITTVRKAEKFLNLEFSKFIDEPDNLEDKAISLVGEVIYQKLIKEYTRKQWQIDPKLLPAEIITRLPVRKNLDNRYFSDTHQGLPLGGYTQWHEKMLKHPNITVQTNTDFFEFQSQIRQDQIVIYTGPIDKFFNYQSGKLSWRTLDFEMETLAIDDYQGNSVINYCDSTEPFTRIHEFKHLHPERLYTTNKTIIMKEYSRFAAENDEPYYPVNTLEDRQKLLSYRKMATKLRNYYFGGRLGTYQYLDMHMAIGSALSMFENELSPRLGKSS